MLEPPKPPLATPLMYTTIKNTSSVTILWKILCNFSLFKQGKAGQGSADLAVIAASWGTGT